GFPSTLVSRLHAAPGPDAAWLAQASRPSRCPAGLTRGDCPVEEPAQGRGLTRLAVPRNLLGSTFVPQRSVGVPLVDPTFEHGGRVGGRASRHSGARGFQQAIPPSAWITWDGKNRAARVQVFERFRREAECAVGR